jgi:serine/threonine-protein kinase
VIETLDRLNTGLTGRYRIERELGRGGMATVYLAHDLKHDRPVALKVLLPDLAHAVGPQRFLREITLAAQLQHPHILPVHDSGSVDGLLWYTMPYVAGESLRQRLTREPQLPLNEALGIAREVAEALGYAHERGIVHRDIKPENILLAAGQHCVIADFGIARALDMAGDKLTATGLAVGTPAYMSPEQAVADTHLDGRSDLYSLGCVLYEMLVGEPPFTGRTPQAIIARRVSEPAPHVSVFRDVPAGVEQVVTTALARSPADRFPNAAQFIQALESAIHTPQVALAPRAPRRDWRIRFGLAAAATFTAVVVALALFRGRGPSAAKALDADLIAIAPFDVLDTSLRLWHEGLVDVLARDLDGAGPLRTVSPTVAIRRWHGRADPASAAELARATGARLAVYGTLVRSASDSVRLAATLLDASGPHALGEIEVRGPSSEMDRLTDSVAIGLLRQLGRSRPVALVPHTGISARSLPALRAFLQAEQYYRRGIWDSAASYAEQAISLDSTFALAYKRASQAIGWGGGDDSVGQVYAMRAAAHNHRLAPRDSLLVVAESLMRVISARGFGARYDPVLGGRMYATIEEAVRRYGDDPEAWYGLGEARHHLGGWLVSTGGWRASREAFERSISLDPLFAPAYYHLVEICFSLGDSAAARRYAAAAIRYNPRGTMTRGFQAVDRLLDARGALAQAAVIDSLPDDLLWDTYESVMRWADSAELSLTIIRRWVKRPNFGGDSNAPSILVNQLAFRGHLREARAAGDSLAMDLFSQAALLGAVSAERATAMFRRCLPGGPASQWSEGWPPGGCMPALSWWNARRDTVSLQMYLEGAERNERKQAGGEFSPSATVHASAARANLALARRDTAAALRAYEPMLATSPGPWWAEGQRLVAAQLLEARGQIRKAANLLYAAPAMEGEVGPQLSDVMWLLERGRVAEQLGDRARAIEAYHYVAEVWRHADTELQPYAAEARAAIARLMAEAST